MTPLKLTPAREALLRRLVAAGRLTKAVMTPSEICEARNAISDGQAFRGQNGVYANLETRAALAAQERADG